MKRISIERTVAEEVTLHIPETYQDCQDTICVNCAYHHFSDNKAVRFTDKCIHLRVLRYAQGGK